ncbi:hypothetical protein [Phenylobacterium sp.]|jgi:hypothetical protein|uniref:hypothetical protein n=1 Tax=Phenylobacterium sp. TaxID=1871053 RepID=UPI002F3E4F79
MTAYTLVVMTNPVEGRADEYNDWYSNQHLSDVLRLPGVMAAQRFKIGEGFDGPHKYMALYQMETSDPAGVLAELTKRANTPEMPISEAMDRNVSMRLFEGITPLMKSE